MAVDRIEAPPQAHGIADAASLRTLGAVIVLVIGAIAPLAYVAAFGLNVFGSEDFPLVLLFDRLLEHPSLGALLTLGTPGPLPVARSIELAFATWTGFDVKDEMFATVALHLVGAFFVMRVAYRRVSRSVWALAPAGLLLLGLAPYDALLRGASVAEALATTAAILAFVALDDLDERPGALWLAIAVGIVASLCDPRGLLAWPAGLIVLRGRGRTALAAWAIAGAATIALVFVADPALAGGAAAAIVAAIAHFPATIGSAVIALGAPFDPRGVEGGAPTALVAIAGVVVAGAVIALAVRWARLPPAAARLPLALAGYGLLYVALLALARSPAGFEDAARSRFTADTLVLYAGTYLGWLAALRDRRSPRGGFALAALAAIAIAGGTLAALRNGPLLLAQERAGAEALLAYEGLTDERIASTFDSDPALVRASAAIAQNRRFSVFAAPPQPSLDLIPESAPARAWSLAPGFALLGTGAERQLAIAGSGGSLGSRYAGSPPFDVAPDRFYRISATIDARRTSGPAPCFYLAEIPSGYGLAITCATNGTIRAYSSVAFVGSGVTRVEWVAFTNATHLARGAALVYSSMAVAAIGP